MAMEAHNKRRTLNREAYTVGWITVINPEFVAAIAMLDEEHERPSIADDPNFYMIGSVNGHNVVIARSGEAGPTPAANCATQMMRSFPKIRIGLLVGIGGGVPSKKNDIRLGDVVISSPGRSYGGVALYDTAKMTDQGFELTGHLNQPPRVLTSAVNYMEARRGFGGSQVSKYLATMKPKGFSSIVGLSDTLYEAGDQTKVVERRERDAEESPMIHYGLIASGSWLIKTSGSKRDDLLKMVRSDVLCFEMEAAGLMNDFPCLVVRGISDYCDSHKNDDWHNYAAASAACYCKWLLNVIRPEDVTQTEVASDVIKQSVSGTNERPRGPDHLQSSQPRIEASFTRRKDCADYTVGWICALPLEMACATAMLDKQHENIPRPRWDDNNYAFGQIGNHNIVIACLPTGKSGIALMASMATKLMISFQNLRISLLVGIGSGIPSTHRDIRLGDIVVARPSQSHGGVVQFDSGRIGPSDHSEAIGILEGPPNAILSALASLEAKHITDDHEISRHIDDMFQRKPKMETLFRHPGSAKDILFKANYKCQSHARGDCYMCDHDLTIFRVSRPDQAPVIHSGTIISGSAFIRDGETRDRFSWLYGAICSDIEAAGVMRVLPCLVIRGICDYGDGHQNRIWQPWAATVAAAYAKELLYHTSTEQMMTVLAP